MDNKQKINCNVSTCRFNDEESCKCILESIVVEPMKDSNTKRAEESMCGSYKYNK